MRWLICLIICSLCIAEDEQVSFYGVAAPLDVLQPGGGLEFGTVVGHRTVLTASANLSAPDNEVRDWSASLGARLLYSSELNTHWYPSVEVEWVPVDRNLLVWTGAGFQRELWSTLGVFGEAQWEPVTTNFKARLGLRLWFTRFSTLDSRVRSSDPVGAVYQGGQRRSSTNTVKDIVIETTESSPVRKTDNSPAVEAPELPRVDATIIDEEPPESAPSSVAVVGRWYVHLGLFQAQESLLDLKNDARLVSYRSELITHFDADKNAFRLLMGPYIKPKAMSVLGRVKTEGLDGFLYQLPSP